MEIVVVLHNIRSTYNVGAILRSADGFGVKRVILSGYTPRVGDTRLLPHLREKLDRQIAKTALGAEKSVKVEASEDICESLRSFREDGYEIVGLENNIEDERLVDISRARELGEKIVLVLGEEVRGIPRELFEYIDTFVEIPMKGVKESLNVSVAAGISLYALTNRG